MIFTVQSTTDEFLCASAQFFPATKTANELSGRKWASKNELLFFSGLISSFHSPWKASAQGGARARQGGEAGRSF
jgi:hypothetical protein